MAQNEEECQTLSEIMSKHIDDFLRKKYLEDQGKEPEKKKKQQNEKGKRKKGKKRKVVIASNTAFLPPPFLFADKHKAMQVTLEDFLKSHRDKPLPPPPPPKNKPKNLGDGSAPSSPVPLRATSPGPALPPRTMSPAPLR